MDESELPDSELERARLLENLMIGRATGDLSADNRTYEYLRGEFMRAPALKGLLPDFVRTCRNLDAFWPLIQSKAPKYAQRRQIISEAFTPLVDHLEGANRSPLDHDISDALSKFDADGVHAVWSKALERRTADPEGAITIARTLLETVCKKILDEFGTPYTDKEDLPKLYSMAAQELKLAPILGGATTVVNGLATLRNRLSDAHGRGGAPVKPSGRHASLAVNVAGSIATFLVETFEARKNI